MNHEMASFWDTRPATYFWIQQHGGPLLNVGRLFQERCALFFQSGHCFSLDELANCMAKKELIHRQVERSISSLYLSFAK